MKPFPLSLNWLLALPALAALGCGETRVNTPSANDTLLGKDGAPPAQAVVAPTGGANNNPASAGQITPKQPGGEVAAPVASTPYVAPSLDIETPAAVQKWLDGLRVTNAQLGPEGGKLDSSALQSRVYTERWRDATRELAALGPEAAPHLAAALRRPDVEIRRGVAFYLVETYDPADARQAAAFTLALTDDDRLVRRLALQVTRRMARPDVERAAPQLAALLLLPLADEISRADAARLLGGLESAARPQLPALLTALRQDSSARVRAAAMSALPRVGAPEAIVPALREALKNDADPMIRRVAAERLGKLGAPAKAALGELSKAAHDQDETVRQAAQQATQAILADDGQRR